MAEIPAHLAGAAQADVDPDLEPAAMDDHDRAVVGGPFATASRSRAAVGRPALAVISAGGVAGALARYGLSEAFPHAAEGFAWATFGINVSGCLLIGVLGGYTTFSTYIVDIQQLLVAGAARTALAYLAGTLVAALTAVYAGIIGTRWAVRRIHHHKEKTR